MRNFLTIHDMAHAFDTQYDLKLTESQQQLAVGDTVMTTKITGNAGFGIVFRDTPFGWCFIDFTCDGHRWFVNCAPKSEVMKVSRWQWLQGLTHLPNVSDQMVTLAKENIKETIELNQFLDESDMCPECKSPLLVSFTRHTEWFATVVDKNDLKVTPPEMSEASTEDGYFRCSMCDWHQQFDPMQIKIKKDGENWVKLHS